MFELVTSDKTNIDFVNVVENTEHLNILEYLYFYNGGGVAIGDINNDGLPDIYFSSNQNRNALYLNHGNFQFEDITISAKVEGKGSWTTGVTMADVNADGLLDIYVCYVDGYKGLIGRNELYINNGDLTFTERAASYGLDFSGFSTQAVFFDYDNDSDLDVYLLNHSVHSPGTYGESSLRNQLDDRSGDKLLQSRFAQGEEKFVDVTTLAGINSSKIGYGLGVAIADINGDGWQDIYVSNDFHENDYLYYNNQDGSFRESLELSLGHSSRYSMGNDVADVNNDGLIDIITTDMLPKDPAILMKSGAEDRLEVSEIKLAFGYGPQLARNSLQLNRGNGFFTDIALFANIFATDWSWSPLIADFDNDGFKDIHITNGIFKRPNDLDYIQYISGTGNLDAIRSDKKRVDQILINLMPSLQIPNEVFRNDGNMHWLSVNSEWGLAQPSYSNGSAYADLDNDGDLDLIVNNVNQPAFVYRNRTNEINPSNHYIKISFGGLGFNKLGIGARIFIKTNNRLIANQVMITRGFQSASEPVLTVGLGNARKIDSIEVYWPSGKYQLLKDLAVDQRIYLIEPLKSEPINVKIESHKLLSESKELILFKHKENVNYHDNDTEYLLPYRFSAQGPTIAIGDVTGDGLEDVFVGGASGQAASLFVQERSGELSRSVQFDFETDSFYEDVGSQFSDVDNDGDLDLLVISGGYEYKNGDPHLEDRLYLNVNGRFVRSPYFPGLRLNSSCLIMADYDKDGDVDIVLGSSGKKGAYGLGGEAILLVNNGEGKFKDETFEKAPGLADLGILKDLQWMDYDNDGDLDIVAVSHWMPITLIENRKGILDMRHEIKNSSGLWNCLELIDVDSDGDLDLVAGNMGLNNKFQASELYPLQLFVNDFDGNGSSDAIIMHYQAGRSIPLFTKDEIEKQVVGLKKKFTSYKDYAEKVNGINSLFDENRINSSRKSKVTELRSSYFINDGNGNFTIYPLPLEMQFSSINTLIIDDLNGDKRPDLISAGNNYNMHINLGRQDGDYGSIALSTVAGNFKYMGNRTSGLDIKGQVNASGKITIKKRVHYLFALNNDSLKFYSKNTYEK